MPVKCYWYINGCFIIKYIHHVYYYLINVFYHLVSLRVFRFGSIYFYPISVYYYIFLNEFLSNYPLWPYDITVAHGYSKLSGLFYCVCYSSSLFLIILLYFELIHCRVYYCKIFICVLYKPIKYTYNSFSL